MSMPRPSPAGALDAVFRNVSATLADVTNGADDTYYYYMDVEATPRWALQLILGGGSGTVTVTVEGTLQDDGTAAAACAYADVTADIFGVASYTASDMLVCDVPIPFKYVRVKVVANTGGADDADWTIYARRMFGG